MMLDSTIKKDMQAQLRQKVYYMKIWDIESEYDHCLGRPTVGDVGKTSPARISTSISVVVQSSCMDGELQLGGT